MTFASSEDLQKVLTCQACCPQEVSKRFSISYLTVDIESLSTQCSKVLSKLKSPKKKRFETFCRRNAYNVLQEKAWQTSAALLRRQLELAEAVHIYIIGNSTL